MVIIRYNDTYEQGSFMCTAVDFRYEKGSHRLTYSHYEAHDHIQWNELKDVDVELNNMNAVPVLHVTPHLVQPPVFDQPKDVPWSETTS